MSKKPKISDRAKQIPEQTREFLMSHGFEIRDSRKTLRKTIILTHTKSKVKMEVVAHNLFSVDLVDALMFTVAGKGIKNVEV